jgi:hypothetical protein
MGEHGLAYGVADINFSTILDLAGLRSVLARCCFFKPQGDFQAGVEGYIKSRYDLIRECGVRS